MRGLTRQGRASLGARVTLLPRRLCVSRFSLATLTSSPFGLNRCCRRSLHSNRPTWLLVVRCVCNSQLVLTVSEVDSRWRLLQLVSRLLNRLSAVAKHALPHAPPPPQPSLPSPLPPPLQAHVCALCEWLPAAWGACNGEQLLQEATLDCAVAAVAVCAEEEWQRQLQQAMRQGEGGCGRTGKRVGGVAGGGKASRGVRPKRANSRLCESAKGGRNGGGGLGLRAVTTAATRLW
eukprot:2165146-Pleurochrysis_carterae.AAC.1